MKRKFHANVPSILINEKNVETISQYDLDYSLLTKLPRIVV